MPATVFAAARIRTPIGIVLVGFLAILLGLYAALTIWSPHQVGFDSSSGFTAWLSMQQGAPFNTIQGANPDNLRENTYAFLTWWTPGQYLVPGGLANLFHIKLGPAIWLLTLVCALLQVSGFYALGRALGFTTEVLLLSTLVLVLHWDFVYFYFNAYNGGEVLLGAVGSWIVLVWWRTRTAPFYQRLLLGVGLGVVGFVAKASFLVLMLGALAGLGLQAVVEYGIYGWSIHFAGPAARAGRTPFLDVCPEPSDHFYSDIPNY